MIEQLVSFDEEMFFWVNNDWSFPLVDAVMIAATISGFFISLVVLGLLIIYFKKGENSRRMAITFLLSMLIGGVAVNAVKMVVQRDRPLKYFEKEIANNKVTVNAPFRQLYHRSFPSGHSQAAFTAAAFFALYYGRRRTLFFSAALLVALSRVYLGVHFPSDIAAGALLGAVTAWFVCIADPKSPCVPPEMERGADGD